jgi:phosphatidylethanolamine-binding protein (PEBP) family uncharacterized protein
MVTKLSLIASVLVLAAAAVGCGGATSPSANNTPEIAFLSPALTASKVIPARYKCDVNKIWLPVRWGALPSGTKELVMYVARYTNVRSTANGSTARLLSQALIVGLKPTLHELQTGKLPHGALVGEYETGSQRVPICPAGRPSQGFIFRLYALRSPLNISKGKQGASLLSKLNSEALAAGTFTASYARA